MINYDFDADLRDILIKIQEYYPTLTKKQQEIVKKAFNFAKIAHQDQKRFSGEPYFIHPIAATKILLSINPDIDTIAACLMHDVIEDTPITVTEIEQKFGKDISFLCEGVEKVAKIRLQKEEGQKKFENFQKLFIAMGKDIRVIFIKLADRIHNLETLNYVRREKQERIALESLEVYAPVASKLGLFEFKNKIETACFEVLYPEDYKRLSQEISETKKIREKFIKQAKKDILKISQKENFFEEIIDLSGREKSIYSVYKKIKRKKLNGVDDIFDLLGLRMIVKTNEDCYRALGLFHRHWRPITGRFKDYISVPKPNGYQSIHTTILGLGQSKLPIEIQIRTQKMHLDAEKGPAAHWVYKKLGHSQFNEEYLKKTAWIPNENILDNLSAEDFFEQISRSILEKKVHIFTPKGDIKFLPKGGTPIDFAYSIHSDIGETCVGAIVNGIIKSLNHPLENGDVVKIITKKGKLPNPLWLNFVKSSSTRDKIQAKLRKENIPVSLKKKSVRKIADKVILPEIPRKIKKINSKPELVIGSTVGLPYKFAPCCSPDIGKALIAYKSRGLKFTIHESSCEELANLDPERFFEAIYQKLARIFVVTQSRQVGILRDCTTEIANLGINIKNVKYNSKPLDKTATLIFDLMINSEKELIILIENLKKIRGISTVEQLT
jgi:RelA/SpoT family (p)ppGpp synthetase